MIPVTMSALTEKKIKMTIRDNKYYEELDAHLPRGGVASDFKSGKEQQDERIKENMKDADFENMSFNDFEDMFEDRDPMEFL
jgi:hypothetical protein